MKTPQQTQAEEMAQNCAFHYWSSNLDFDHLPTRTLISCLKSDILEKLNLVALITERDELLKINQNANEAIGDIAEECKKYAAQLETLKKQNEELLKAAKILSDKLEVIHNDPLYLSVWTMYQIHGGDYTNGPKYDKELETLRSAITATMKGTK